jgi:protein gp37
VSDNSSIEWTDATWNPVTGCTKVSPGCDHCYAETMHERFHGKGSFATVTLAPHRLSVPLKWRKPRRVFVNSMSDLFHDDVSNAYIARVFGVMAACPQHTFQILTKRHNRMRSLLNQEMFRESVFLANNLDQGDVLGGRWPLPNVWLGVSTEDQKWADIRIPALLDTPATVRWISAEPLLGQIDLTRMGPRKFASALHPSTDQDTNIVRRGLDWVVVGGESGPGARPMQPAWARSLRDQCAAADVPFLFKQWGAWAPNGKRGLGDNERERCVGERNDLGMREVIERVGKGRAGRVLDGRTWDSYPEVA